MPTANLFEEQVEVLFKAFNNESFSDKGKHYTIPADVPYRGYQLKELTLMPRRSNCRSNAGSGAATMAEGLTQAYQRVANAMGDLKPARI